MKCDHNHPPKEYCRIAQNNHEQFVGNWKLRKGAIYGRIWSETRNIYMYFVSNTRQIINNDKVRVWIKEGNKDWSLEKISLDSRINQMIVDCIKKNGAPVLGRYNVPRKKQKKEKEQKEVLIINGKRYVAFSNENPLPDMYISEDLYGILPTERKIGKYDSYTGRPQFVPYIVKYAEKIFWFNNCENAEKFCEENGISKDRMEPDCIDSEIGVIGNDNSYQMIHKDIYRKTGYDKKLGMYI